MTTAITPFILNLTREDAALEFEPIDATKVVLEFQKESYLKQGAFTHC